MSSLQFLGIEDAIASGVTWPDVYFTPEYGRCAEESDRAQWEVALWESGRIVYPYLLRPVAHSLPDRLWDLTAPYGYAGPWGREGTNAADWKRFRGAFRANCRERGIIAEFVRFHPLLPAGELVKSADPDMTLVRHGSTVSVDLGAGGHEAAWQRYEGRARTAVRKARNAGYAVQIRPATEVDFPARRRFRELYESTMQRVGAHRYYIFPPAYYDHLWSALAPHVVLGEVLAPAGETVAAALFLHHGVSLHYHLAGSEIEHARQGVNNLLLDELAAWGARGSKTRFHLGGGLSRDDALFKFKAAMGRDEHQFWLGRTILSREHYERIVWEAAESRGESVSSLQESGFFPAYRAPQPARAPETAVDPTPSH